MLQTIKQSHNPVSKTSVACEEHSQTHTHLAMPVADVEQTGSVVAGLSEAERLLHGTCMGTNSLGGPLRRQWGPGGGMTGGPAQGFSAAR